MIRKYRIDKKEASLQEVLDYLEDELKRGGNASAFEELGIDFCDVDVLTDLEPKLRERIRQEYTQLENIVMLLSPFTPIKSVCESFKGYNLDVENGMFDVYWGENKSMIATVHQTSAGFYLGQCIEYLIDDMYVEIDIGSWSERNW